MDAVYMSYSRRWVSEPFDIKDYFDIFRILLKKYESDARENKKNYMQAMNAIMGEELSEDNFLELENYCCIEKLNVPNEPGTMHADYVRAKRGIFEVSPVPHGVFCDLETIKHVRKQNSVKRMNNTNLKYTSTIWLNPSTEGKPDMKPREETLLMIRVYEPFNYLPGARTGKPFLHCMFEIAVRTTQTLDVFRDKIACTSDFGVAGEISENPDQPIVKTAKDIYKSGFLFIEDVFYNDFRDPKNIDYSECIREWAKGKKLGPFKTADMAKTKFEDLTVRFGFPYVFQHQGKCEHLIVFSDARFIREDDSLIADSYPLYASLGARKTRYCLVCNLYMAKWVTRGNDQVYIDPCYFCDPCFKSCNYKDGNKIGNFTAYRFYDRACIL